MGVLEQERRVAKLIQEAHDKERQSKFCDFSLPSKSSTSGTQLHDCTLTCTLHASPSHKAETSTTLLCCPKALTKSRCQVGLLRASFLIRLSGEPHVTHTCSTFPPVHLVKDTKEPSPQLLERKGKHFQPHIVVLGNFCNRGYWWYRRKILEQDWEAVNLSYYPLIIFMVQNESCNSFKGKQDLPRGSHFVDKATRK